VRPGVRLPTRHCKKAFSPLVGTTVTGSLVFDSQGINFWDPANSTVSAGFENHTANSPTVTSSATAVEFGSQNTALHTADFTDTQLTVSLLNNSGNGSDQLNETMTFTDTAFAGGAFTIISDNFITGGLTSCAEWFRVSPQPPVTTRCPASRRRRADTDCRERS
jgi:hypothetical protein